MKPIFALTVLTMMAVVSTAIAGGGESGLPGNDPAGEPNRTPATLTCGDRYAGANGLENNGRFDAFSILLPSSGAEFVGWLDLINANSTSQWDVNNRRAITEKFLDNGHVMSAQFRALPADDIGAGDTAKRIDLIEVSYARGNGIATIHITSELLTTGHKTSTAQQLPCVLSPEM